MDLTKFVQSELDIINPYIKVIYIVVTLVSVRWAPQDIMVIWFYEFTLGAVSSGLK